MQIIREIKTECWRSMEESLLNEGVKKENIGKILHDISILFLGYEGQDPLTVNGSKKYEGVHFTRETLTDNELEEAYGIYLRMQKEGHCK